MKPFSNFIRLLIISTLLLFNVTVNACIDSDTPEMLQLLLFRAQIPGMDSKSYFYYTPDLYYHYRDDYYSNSNPSNFDSTDIARNIIEWQQKTGHNIPFNDIFDILYKTELSELKGAFLTKQLIKQFKNNQFIKCLTLKGNEKLLQYLIFAKDMEALQLNYNGRFESWDTIPQLKTQSDYYYNDYWFTAFNNNYKTYIIKATNEFKKTNDRFLKERYAFQLCRMYYYSGNGKACIKTYNDVFKNQKQQSLMQIWSRYFMGICLPNEIENYYYTSLTQHDCDSKDLICGMKRISTSKLEKVLVLAKNQQEKAYILSNYCLTYTPPALSYLKRIYNFDKSSNDLPFLLLREINKLEDWLYTPYSNSHSYNWSTPYLKSKNLFKIFKAQNLKTDELYLENVTNLVLKLEASSDYKNKDFYRISLSHLYLLQENYKLAKMWLNEISSKANSSILQQKQVDKLLLASKTEDIKKEQFQQLLIQTIRILEKANNKQSAETMKLLYSINYCIANLYEKNGESHITAQMILRADTYKQKTYEYFAEEYWYDKNEYNYWYIDYYDVNEDYNALNKMIGLIQKKSKTAFEKYLLQYSLPLSYYYDVLGTIAFRQNKLELALQYLNKIAPDFWNKNEPYKEYLNEDPYTPRCLTLTKNRKYNYRVNKAALVKKIIELKSKVNTPNLENATSYKVLGDIYYNCCQSGNAWMMTSYFNGYNSSWSVFYSIQNLTIDRSDNPFQNKLNLAKKYYKLTYQTAGNNKELKAYSLLMLAECERFTSTENAYDDNPKYSPLTVNYFKSFLKEFANTKTYKQYYCPLMQDFILKN
jgi:hypothetical protein